MECLSGLTSETRLQGSPRHTCCKSLGDVLTVSLLDVSQQAEKHHAGRLLESSHLGVRMCKPFCSLVPVHHNNIHCISSQASVSTRSKLVLPFMNWSICVHSLSSLLTRIKILSFFHFYILLIFLITVLYYMSNFISATFVSM